MNLRQKNMGQRILVGLWCVSSAGMLWAQSPNEEEIELLLGGTFSQEEARSALLNNLPQKQEYSYGLNLEGGAYFSYNTNAQNALRAALLSIHNAVLSLNGVDSNFNPDITATPLPLTSEFYQAILLLTQNYPSVVNGFNNLSTPFSYGGFFQIGMSIQWHLWEDLDHYMGKLVNDTLDFGVYTYLGYGSLADLLQEERISNYVEIYFGGYINLFRVLGIQSGAVYRIFIARAVNLTGRHDGIFPTLGVRLRILPLYDNLFVNLHFDTVFHPEDFLFNEYRVGLTLSYDWQKHF